MLHATVLKFHIPHEKIFDHIFMSELCPFLSCVLLKMKFENLVRKIHISKGINELESSNLVYSLGPEFTILPLS